MNVAIVILITAVYALAAAVIGVNGLALMGWLMVTNPVETVVGVMLVLTAPWIKRINRRVW